MAMQVGMCIDSRGIDGIDLNTKHIERDCDFVHDLILVCLRL